MQLFTDNDFDIYKLLFTYNDFNVYFNKLTMTYIGISYKDDEPFGFDIQLSRCEYISLKRIFGNDYESYIENHIKNIIEKYEHNKTKI